MKNESGFVHWVVVILISVMAIGLAVTAWYYESNKDKKPASNAAISNKTNTNTTNTNSKTVEITNETTSTAVNTEAVRQEVLTEGNTNSQTNTSVTEIK